MRILHVTNAAGWSGGMKQMLLLIGGLEKRGHENVLVCPPGCELIPRFAGSGTKIEILPMFQDYDLAAAWKLRGLIKKYSPDIVHSHHAISHAIALLSLVFTKEPPLIVSRRVSFKPRKNPFSVWKYRSGRINKYSVVSRSVMETLAQSGVPRSIIEVIYSAVDPEEFKVDASVVRDLRNELDIPDGVPVVGKIANYSRWKGQHIFLQAAKILLSKNIKVIFVLAGKGTETLEPMARKLGIAESVRLLGFRKDIPAILNMLSVSVNSSIEGEGLSGAMRESLLLGIPVVASDVSGNAEVVKNNETGFLVPVDDPYALAERIVYALENRHVSGDMAKKGREWVLKNATIDTMVENFIKLYSSLM